MASSRFQPLINRVVPPFGIALCSVFVLIGVVWGVRTVAFLYGAETAPGTIVDLVEYVDDEGSTLYRPVFSYEGAGGESHTVVSSTASSPPTVEVGDRIEVVYRPDEPGKGRIKSFVHLWLIPVGFVGLGSFGAVVFAAVGWMIRRRS